MSRARRSQGRRWSDSCHRVNRTSRCVLWGAVGSPGLAAGPRRELGTGRCPPAAATRAWTSDSTWSRTLSPNWPGGRPPMRRRSVRQRSAVVPWARASRSSRPRSDSSSGPAQRSTSVAASPGSVGRLMPRRSRRRARAGCLTPLAASSDPGSPGLSGSRDHGVSSASGASRAAATRRAPGSCVHGPLPASWDGSVGAGPRLERSANCRECRTRIGRSPPPVSAASLRAASSRCTRCPDRGTS